MFTRERSRVYPGDWDCYDSFGRLSIKQLQPFPLVFYNKTPYREGNLGDSTALNNSGHSHMLDDGRPVKGAVWKNCLHNTSKLAVFGSDLVNCKPYTVIETDGVGRTMEYTHEIQQFPLRHVAASAAKSRQSGLDTYELRRVIPDGLALSRAYEDMLPQTSDIGHNTTFLVFLAELRDFKYLVKCLRSPTRQLLDLQKLAHVKNLGEVIRELTRLGAEGRLLIEYCIRPFISDLMSIKDGVFGMRSFLKQWNKAATGRAIYVRHRRLDSIAPAWSPELGSETQDEYYIHGLFPGGKRYRLMTKSSYECIGFAHLWYYPECVETGGVKDLMRRYDALGLGHAGSNIWNAIPFSFLLDYVVTTDEFFSQFDKNMTVLPVSVAGFGWSVKQILGSQATASAMGALGQAVAYRTLYERSASSAPAPSEGVPAIFRIRPDRLRPVVPSYGQMGNVVALLRAMKRR